MQLINEMLDNSVKAYPSKDAVVFENSRFTYKDLNQKVNRLANGLRKIGIGKGDLVMVQLVNGQEIITSHYAIIKSGAIAVPLNVMYVAHEISYIGNDTGAKAIIVDSSFLPMLRRVQADLPDLKHIIVVGDAVTEGELCFQELISDSSEKLDLYNAGFDDIVSIIYTSGTTGWPKGATQTHRSILSNVSSCCDFNKFNRDDRLLCALPLFNNFAINVVMMCAFYSGATLIVTDRFNADKVLKKITEHKATYFAGTPTMFVYLLQAFNPDSHDVSTMRVVNSGGAHCPARVIEDTEKTFQVI